MDLTQAGINTIIWATGFDWDYRWIKLPIFDEYGYPNQEQGVAEYPGLYFLGLHWLHKHKSGLFLGIGEDAGHIAGGQQISISANNILPKKHEVLPQKHRDTEKRKIVTTSIMSHSPP